MLKYSGPHSWVPLLTWTYEDIRKLTRLKKSESHIVGIQFPVAFREVVLKREGMLVVQLPLIVLDASLRRLHSTASVGSF